MVREKALIQSVHDLILNHAEEIGDFKLENFEEKQATKDLVELGPSNLIQCEQSSEAEE